MTIGATELFQCLWSASVTLQNPSMSQMAPKDKYLVFLAATSICSSEAVVLITMSGPLLSK